MSGIEREDYLRGREFAFPAFIESVMKTQRMSEAGVTAPRGKIIRDEKGKPICLKAGEGIAQVAGSRSARHARVSGEHWTVENVQKQFKGKKGDPYAW